MNGQIQGGVFSAVIIDDVTEIWKVNDATVLAFLDVPLQIIISIIFLRDYPSASHDSYGALFPGLDFLFESHFHLFSWSLVLACLKIR